MATHRCEGCGIVSLALPQNAHLACYEGTHTTRSFVKSMSHHMLCVNSDRGCLQVIASA